MRASFLFHRVPRQCQGRIRTTTHSRVTSVLSMHNRQRWPGKQCRLPGSKGNSVVHCKHQTVSAQITATPSQHPVYYYIRLLHAQLSRRRTKGPAAGKF